MEGVCIIALTNTGCNTAYRPLLKPAVRHWCLYTVWLSVPVWKMIQKIHRLSWLVPVWGVSVFSGSLLCSTYGSDSLITDLSSCHISLTMVHVHENNTCSKYDSIECLKVVKLCKKCTVKKKEQVLHPCHVLRGRSTHTFFTGGEALLLTSVLILMCKIGDVLHPTVKFPLWQHRNCVTKLIWLCEP